MNSNTCVQQVFGGECDCRYCMEGRVRRRKRGPLPQGRRQAVLERDKFTCRYCGDPATSVDHVIPWSRGGRNTMDNLVASCQPCNEAKGDQIVQSDWIPPPRPVRAQPVAPELVPDPLRRVWRLGERVLYWKGGCS